MRKTSKKTVLYLILLLFISIGTYNILSYYDFFKETLIIMNNTVYSESLPKNNFKSTYTSKINFKDMPVTEIKGVTLNILDKSTIKNTPILLKAQRYYIPINLISNNLGYNVDISNDSIALTNEDNKITLNEDNFTKNSTIYSLRGNIIINNDEHYISISDIENMFDLIALFNFEENSISLLPSNVTKTNSSSTTFSKKIAMIRFEDFTAGDSNFVDRNQTKVKFMTDLLYSEGIKFHVAWIPRFKAPLDNIDNNLLEDTSIKNVGFINLLDYLINKGGEIGLHGYTHQSGTDRSAVGEELSKDVNNTVPKTREVIENGIDTASALNIPITFYESPHYRDTKLQQSVIEEYFQLVYEPYDNSKRNIYLVNNHLYVPTPLGYVQDPNNISSIIDGLKKCDPKVLSSFFYHPSIELDFLDFNVSDNKLNVQYDKNSPLQQITHAIKDNGYTTIHIDQLIHK